MFNLPKYNNHRIFYLIFKRRFISKPIALRMNDISTGPIASTITEKLQESLSPSYLEVINESYQHNVPKGAETHFKVVVVSSKFEGLPFIKRHRLVNQTLTDELNRGVHALSIVAKTPDQWEESNKIIEKSPPCKGGFGK